MNFDEKINELKLKLPEARAPVGSLCGIKNNWKIAFYIRTNFY